MNWVSRIAALPLLILLVGAAAPLEIPYAPGDDEALVIPVDSPVRFTGFDKSHVARFDGRFEMAGTFIFSCSIECEPPLKKWQVYGEMIPDPAVAKRLPHWKIRNGDMRIYVERGDRLARQIAKPEDLRSIRSGKIDEVRRHVTIVVDDFQAGIECDGATYSARFLAIARAINGGANMAENEGC